MNYRNKVVYVCTKKLNKSFKEIQDALANGRITIDNQIISENVLISPYQLVKLDQILVQNPEDYKYFAYYKPIGIECTLNPDIQDNLLKELPEKDLFYAGRLDKKSEGLLLLTNDGHIYNKIISPDKEIIKEYEVELESPIAPGFIEKMRAGVFVLNQMTKPCEAEIIDEKRFQIKLTQGLNRQIRRMCFELGNYVIGLKRLKIGEINLGALEPGQIRLLNVSEIAFLRRLK